MRRADRVREILEREIVSQRLPPGTRLDEPSLARRFEVSRTPIREALNQLAAVGLIEMRPSRSPVVAALTAQDLVNGFEVMTEMEGLCGRLAARRADETDHAELESLHREMRVALDDSATRDYYRLDQDFHEILYRACRNALLAKQLRNLRRRFAPYRRRHFRLSGRARQSWQEHGRLLAAIRDGDAGSARPRQHGRRRTRRLSRRSRRRRAAEAGMRIAVIGGGHGCYAAAADLALQGHEVRLWRRGGDAFAEVLDSGTITLTDLDGTRPVELALPTTDLAAAIAGAELIVMPLPATTQASLAPQVAPLLEDGQVVFLPPGTFGGFLLARAMKNAGNGAAVAFAETGTLPYLTRKHSETAVTISVRATRLPTGVWPARDSERALAVIRAAYPTVEPLQDLLDGALMNAGPIIHPPLILMNAGPLEHFETWDIHNEGTQPAIRRVTDALDAERIALREALGYGAPHFPLADHYDDTREEWMYGNSSHEKPTDSGDWREDIDLTTHRYMREDVALGLVFYASLGAWAGVDMPISRGLVAVASGVVGEDLMAGPRAWASLGLGGLDHAGLRRMLDEGTVP